MAFSDPTNQIKMDSYEQSSYSTVDQILSLNSASQSIDGSILPTVVPTLGGIIRSFQPVQMSGVTFGYNAQQSTRGDVMVGGHGVATSNPGGVSSGVMSPFEGAYTRANASSTNQGGFGGFLNSLAETTSSIAKGIGSAVNVVNHTVGSATQLANLVSGGAFSRTNFGKSISTFQSNMNQNVRAFGTVSNAARSLSDTFNSAITKFGSLLKIPVKK